MNRASPVLVLMLAGCGRIGFQGAAGSPADGDAGDTISVVLTSDEYGAEPAGTPISQATVLIDRGGALERAATDDAGAVQFPSADVVAYHVIYKSDLGWRIYTVAPPQTGAVELGGRAAFNLNRSMTVSVPPGSGLDQFTARLPDECAILPLFGTPTMTFEFNPACEGRSVRMVAFRLRSGSGEYIDAGNVTLVNASTYTVTGSYVPVPADTIELSNLPVGTSSVQADILVRNGVDLTRLSPSYDTATPQGRSATVMTSAAPGGNALSVQATYDLPLQYTSTSGLIAPAVIGSTTSFDASAMLPLFTSLTVNRLPSLSWTGGGPGGTLIAVEAITGMLQWDAYVAPAMTSVTFPALPADLGVPVPQGFDLVTVTKLDVPGMTAADLARTFDRTWGQWPNSADLLPSAGSSIAHILYTSALGPPITASPSGSP